MIGQKEIQAKLTTQIANDCLPRFIILVGPRGSGKKLLCDVLARKLKVPMCTFGTGVDDVRQMIAQANRVSLPALYVIPDADNMSVAAKNALLKVTEEPPRNVRIVLTLTDLNNTLGTIKSRGTVFVMDRYTVPELIEYATVKTNYTLHDNEADIIKEICETPGDINLLMSYPDPIVDVYGYVEKVVDNIATVSGANSFKIGQMLAFKATDAGYDLALFWKAFMCICSTRLADDPYRYATGIRITSKYLQQLRQSSVNKQSTFDMWLLDIRQEWM